MSERYIGYERMGAFFSALLEVGIEGYLFLMLFIVATIVLAKIMLKFSKKNNYRYSKLFAYCVIGLVLGILLKLFKFNLSSKVLEFFVCFILNVVFFIGYLIIKYKDKIFGK